MEPIRKIGTKPYNKRSSYKVTFWLFKCPYCGKKIERILNNGKRYQSCGCANKQLKSKTGMIHGDAKRGQVTRLYRIWRNMKERCERPSNSWYKYYGGKGVKVCKEWQEYKNFKKWALENGYQDDLTIDRIDSDWDYCPENCQWLSASENYSKASDERKKLNFKKATLIREEYERGHISKNKLAIKHGVLIGVIRRLLANQTYQRIYPK